jgi:hypothetical protein
MLAGKFRKKYFFGKFNVDVEEWYKKGFRRIVCKYVALQKEREVMIEGDGAWNHHRH